MNLDALGYTVFDDLARSFDDWLSQTPYWVVGLIVVVLGILFIVSVIKKLFVFAVVLGVAALVVCGFWFYSTSFV